MISSLHTRLSNGIKQSSFKISEWVQKPHTELVVKTALIAVKVFVAFGLVALTALFPVASIVVSVGALACFRILLEVWKQHMEKQLEDSDLNENNHKWMLNSVKCMQSIYKCREVLGILQFVTLIAAWNVAIPWIVASGVLTAFDWIDCPRLFEKLNNKILQRDLEDSGLQVDESEKILKENFQDKKTQQLTKKEKEEFKWQCQLEKRRRPEHRLFEQQCANWFAVAAEELLTHKKYSEEELVDLDPSIFAVLPQLTAVESLSDQLVIHPDNCPPRHLQFLKKHQEAAALYRELSPSDRKQLKKKLISDNWQEAPQAIVKLRILINALAPKFLYTKTISQGVERGVRRHFLRQGKLITYLRAELAHLKSRLFQDLHKAE